MRADDAGRARVPAHAASPRVLYVMLGETDEWAHGRRYDLYLDAASAATASSRRLWETVQSLPAYRGRTALVLATDHGRGATPADWTDHGEKVPAAERIWMAVMGPGLRALGVRDGRRGDAVPARRHGRRAARRGFPSSLAARRSAAAGPSPSLSREENDLRETMAAGALALALVVSASAAQSERFDFRAGGGAIVPSRRPRTSSRRAGSSPPPRPGASERASRWSWTTTTAASA